MNRPTPTSASRRIAVILIGAAALMTGNIALRGAEIKFAFRKSSPQLRTAAGTGMSPSNEQDTPPLSPKKFNPDPGGGPAGETGANPMLLFPKEAAIPTPLALPRGDVIGHDPIRKTFTYPTYPLGREGLGLLPHATGVPNRWLIPFPRWERYRDASTEAPYMYDTPRLWHPYQQSRLKGDFPVIGQDIFLNLTAKNLSIFEMRKLPVPSGVTASMPNSAEFFGRGDQVVFLNDTSVAFDLFKGETAFKPVQWLLRVNAVYNNNWARVRESNLLFPLGRNTQSAPVPQTGSIGAIAPSPSGVNPVSGNPGTFASDVNPSTLFNYLAPKLQPLGNAQPLVESPGTGGAKPVAAPSPATRGTGDLRGTRFTTRSRDFFALQEAFVELHLGDVSDNYDFISSRVGTQPFLSDFRGFIFSDTNLGLRVFGNADNNRSQYNLAYFNMREKDTYSGLNSLAARDQDVIISNYYRQDFLTKGYTAQASIHVNLDHGETHYDRNGFLVRPQLIGTVPDNVPPGNFERALRGHDVSAVYLGWAGDGHIGRWNITHAFYQVFGEDRLNPIAGRRTDINAQMGAFEVSYDRDWLRLKLSGFYASGDADPTDRTARGFDTILDSPLLIGGPFSWYVHEGINLPGTSVNLKQPDSLVMNLRTSKTQGQANFVNPGALILGFGADMELTPKLRAFMNVNYIWLAEPAAVKIAIQTDRVRNDLGLDASFGFKYRPFLTENIVIAAGMGFFFPGGGYRDLYRSTTAQVPGFTTAEGSGKADSMLYNAFFSVSLVY